jgi:23S rRNA (cytosine1962-C5)-methyltransferase
MSKVSSINEKPRVFIKKGRSLRIKRGHPWVYSNEIERVSNVNGLKPGSVVEIRDAGDLFLGLALFNPHTLIAGRLLSRNIKISFDTEYFVERLTTALEVRNSLYDQKYYRLVHAEADNLPGLIIDRFNDAFVCQPNTAGMELFWPEIQMAIKKVFNPRIIIMRGDSHIRKGEGLKNEVKITHGSFSEPIKLYEGGITFLIDPLEGQKTGWYFDQKNNRTFAASLAKGNRILDVYSNTGAFGLISLKAGAKDATLIDTSQRALDIALKTAKEHNLDQVINITKGEAFSSLERLSKEGQKYGLVIADPPAFAKTKKDKNKGLRAYRKLARLAATLVGPRGYLIISSCSYNAGLQDFMQSVAAGILDGGRTARLIRVSGAGPDHPIHPQLLETSYLKCLTFSLE